ncbi:hypothetical protein [Microbispora triticiradicis]|uniref:hypothetical protein n=1 Tax=Microbispora triticiradicis TaxID=2200763 RepID=UPI001AD60A99|nr:hypothetical protein [Microbispora triticiradicis]MBO4273121.1 hypothetical protein [Microbispora triticiradicis]
MKRLRRGRLSVYLEPRDIWVGVYVAPAAVYVCPLPLLVLKWDRRTPEQQAFVDRLHESAKQFPADDGGDGLTCEWGCR